MSLSPFISPLLEVPTFYRIRIKEAALISSKAANLYEYNQYYDSLGDRPVRKIKKIATFSPMAEITKEILKDFGAHLKKIRESKKLTLLDLEVRSGIDNGDISKIENGKINIAFTTLAKLATGLEVKMSKLVDFDRS